MLIIIDKKLPEEAKISLRSHFPEDTFILELATEGITYPAISGHPDIFFFPAGDNLIAAPNLPEQIISQIESASYRIIRGNSRVGVENHHSTFIHYNAASGERHLVHRLEYTDHLILENSHFLKKIPVKQGYTRCNLIFLKNDDFITSDEGIFRSLKEHGLEGIYVTPEDIILPDFPNGFIGGCAGIHENTVFLTGSLRFHKQGNEIRGYLSSKGYKIAELCDAPLFDGGGILFF